MNREQLLESRIADHQASLREFVTKARDVPIERWLAPRAEGKWTPAQEARHLVLGYEAFMRDIGGGVGMQLRGSPWRRLLWRWLGLTSILWRKRIPVAARAPRESRPEWETVPASELLPELERRASEFEATLSRAWRDEPDRTVTHPYFGRITLDQTLQLVAVHNRHHAAFLP
jgi:uncharacterized damage-inducible protein DinB